MVDIATALNNIAKAIVQRSKLKKAMTIEPFLITPPVNPNSITQAVMPGIGLNVYYFSLRVRSMGTATYIAVGRAGSQEERMTVVGEIYEAEAPKGAYLNTAETMIRADVADSIIEVGGVLVPEEML